MNSLTRPIVSSLKTLTGEAPNRRQSSDNGKSRYIFLPLTIPVGKVVKVRDRARSSSERGTFYVFTVFNVNLGVPRLEEHWLTLAPHRYTADSVLTWLEAWVSAQHRRSLALCTVDWSQSGQAEATRNVCCVFGGSFVSLSRSCWVFFLSGCLPWHDSTVLPHRNVWSWMKLKIVHKIWSWSRLR